MFFLYLVIIPVAQVFLTGGVLWIGTRMANVERSRYRDCLVISLILTVVGTMVGALAAQNPHLKYLYSLVHLVLPILLIRWYFKASWVKSMLVGVFTGLWWLLALLVLTPFLRFIP